MYLSGTIKDYDHRLSALNRNVVDLELYELEAHNNYTGLWVSGHELERHQKILYRGATMINFAHGLTHYMMLTGIKRFE